jgi:hypothetical protein
MNKITGAGVILGLSQVTLIILKITGVIDINWAVVLIPLWIIGLVIVGIIVAAFIIVKKESSDTIRQWSHEGKEEKKKK